MTTSSDRGFVRVACKTCNNPDVWFRCNQCNKSDHFLFDGTKASCDCGAEYDSGNCTCGATVPVSELEFVAFEKGPQALADLEIAWERLAVLAIVVLVVIGLGIWAWMG